MVRTKKGTQKQGGTSKPSPQKAKASPTKRHKAPNWDLDNDSALLKLAVKRGLIWDQIQIGFKTWEHRCPNETEKTLEKRWKLMIGKLLCVFEQ